MVGCFCSGCKACTTVFSSGLSLLELGYGVYEAGWRSCRRNGPLVTKKSCPLHEYLMVLHLLLLRSRGLHLLRSGRVFVSFSFSKADPLFDPVTAAAHITVMLANLMCNCSLRVKMQSLWWLQRSAQDSYTPSFWVLLVSGKSEGEASPGVLSLQFIPSKVFTNPFQPELPYPHAWEIFSRGRTRTCCQGAWSWNLWECLDIKRFSPPTCSLHTQPSAADSG